MVVMVQKEVAQRMTAAAGSKEYGALSVAVQLRADVELVGVVSPHVFFPKPAVESAVVRLSLRPLPEVVEDEEVLFAVVRAAFGERRKTLRNALRARTAALVRGGGGRLLSRPRAWTAAGEGETLSLAEFVRVANALARAGHNTSSHGRRRGGSRTALRGLLSDGIMSPKGGGIHGFCQPFQRRLSSSIRCRRLVR